MSDPITIPCCHCDARILAKDYAAHLKNCMPRGAATESDAERDDTQQKQMTARGDFGPAGLSPYEKRLLREGKTFAKPTKKAGG